MAHIELSGAVGKLTGKLDGWLYRQVNGKTVVQTHRGAAREGPSAAQQTQRERFRAAQHYAAEVLAHPLRRLAYQKLARARQRPPNALLVSNFLNPPSIEQIELNGYKGTAGHRIEIVALDAIAVAEVSVRILTAAGALVEAGSAVPDHDLWTYCTTQNVPAGTSWRVEITARNRARAEAVTMTE
jgi:hypothetical protein